MDHDNYHIIDLIGEGCYGKVYKCRKKYTNKIYALKVIPKKGKSIKELNSLRSEIEIVRNLSHPNIIQFYDSFETDHDFHLVTEYAYTDLYQIIQEEEEKHVFNNDSDNSNTASKSPITTRKDKLTLSRDMIQSICYQLVQGLYYLHSNRVIHRDIKSQNILISSTGRLKICDFGFAKTISSHSVMLTSLKGTPLYLAPEILKEQPYDHKADLWSLGILLYQLVTGKLPFVTDNIGSLIHLVLDNTLKLSPSSNKQHHKKRHHQRHQRNHSMASSSNRLSTSASDNGDDEDDDDDSNDDDNDDEYSNDDDLNNQNNSLPYEAIEDIDIMSLLKGLLCKDPEKRISWPEILSHPFIASFKVSPISLNLFLHRLKPTLTNSKVAKQQLYQYKQHQLDVIEKEREKKRKSKKKILTFKSPSTSITATPPVAVVIESEMKQDIHIVNNNNNNSNGNIQIDHLQHLQHLHSHQVSYSIPSTISSLKLEPTLQSGELYKDEQISDDSNSNSNSNNQRDGDDDEKITNFLSPMSGIRIDTPPMSAVQSFRSKQLLEEDVSPPSTSSSSSTSSCFSSVTSASVSFTSSPPITSTATPAPNEAFSSPPTNSLPPKTPIHHPLPAAQLALPSRHPITSPGSQQHQQHSSGNSSGNGGMVRSISNGSISATSPLAKPLYMSMKPAPVLAIPQSRPQTPGVLISPKYLFQPPQTPNIFELQQQFQQQQQQQQNAYLSSNVNSINSTNNNNNKNKIPPLSTPLTRPQTPNVLRPQTPNIYRPQTPKISPKSFNYSTNNNNNLFFSVMKSNQILQQQLQQQQQQQQQQAYQLQSPSIYQQPFYPQQQQQQQQQPSFNDFHFIGERIEIESNDGIEGYDFWSYHESLSSQSEENSIKLLGDKSFIQKIVYHLQASCTLQIEVLPVNSILRTFSNLMRAHKNISKSSGGNGSSSGNNTELTQEQVSNSVKTPPPTPYIQYSFNQNQSGNNGNSHGNANANTYCTDLIYKASNLHLLINLLSNILASTLNGNGGMPQQQVLNSPFINLVECLDTIHIFFQTIQPSLSLLIPPPSPISSPHTPLTPNTPTSSPTKKQFMMHAHSNKQQHTQQQQQQLQQQQHHQHHFNLFLSIVNHLLKNISLYNANIQTSIINMITCFFGKLGDAPLNLFDIYKKILENSDILSNLCHYLFIHVHLNNSKFTPAEIVQQREFVAIIKCLAAFLNTCPTAVMEFPMDAKRGNYYAHQQHVSSVLCYHTAGNIIGDGLSVGPLVSILFEALENPLLQQDVLSLFLHCSRASRLLVEAIHKEEKHNLETNATNKKSLFDYLNDTNTNSNSLILLLLGTILMHIPESIDWIIQFDIVQITLTYFCCNDHRLSSCASFFVGAFLSEAMHVEKEQLNNNNSNSNNNGDDLVDAADNDEEISMIIDQVIESIPMKFIRRLFGSKRVPGQTMRDLEGGCFGRPYLGLLDGAACILLRLIKRGDKEFLETMLESGIWEALCHQISDSTTEVELSPHGVIYALRVVYEVLSKNTAQHISYLVKNNLLVSLCQLLESSHLERLKDWPSIQLGGSSGINALVTQIICILYLPLSSRSKASLDASLLELIHHIMSSQQLIRNVIHLLTLLPLESLDLPLGLLSNVILEDPQFSTQFVQFGGLDPQYIHLLLNTEKNSSILLVDSLIILSQLARVSDENYKAIHKADIYHFLKKLLNHPDPNVRSKTCNLIGNLFKFNDYFYQPIRKNGILPLLVSRCSDPDPNTRKFASFALGNAAFYSDLLYSDLADSIQPLTTLLVDLNEDEKTRSNVIGALGNLARNSHILCTTMIEAGVLNAFIYYLNDDNVDDDNIGTNDQKEEKEKEKENNGKQRQHQHTNLLKGVLFSLGYFCLYEQCRNIIKIQFPYLNNLLDHLLSSNQEDQSVISKYIYRIKKMMSFENSDSPRNDLIK
ncbi:hypothetical protein CYY_002354 [Polysphondylium violaceum]|uniref:non-specific serine/threonine protein kinase n=1 Tax=Polysphondylium violaceum TaxID=133409 RepID=A0A8J4V2Z3_9MYCE|nr:hypothetical protein CYY_002354 [Polysphondylium violaceum]